MAEPIEAEAFELPAEIIWPQGISEHLEQTIRSAPKGKNIHEIVLSVMGEEKNQLNRILPESLPDRLSNEIIAYSDVIDRLKRAFKVQDPHSRKAKIPSLSIIAGQIKGQLPKDTNFQDTHIAELQHDRDLLKKDPTGFSLVDSFLKEAAQQAGGFEGVNQGTFRAVSRYKELHSSAKRVR